MSFASPPNSSLVGAVDQGTSSTRFLIFDSIRSELITYHQVPITQIFPREGWVEEDPKEILSSVKACINKAVENLKGLDIDPSALKAIGITNQRETLIVWDKLTGEPLYNAIVWLDTRTIDTVDQLIEKCHNKDFLRRKCGLPLSTYFSAVKMKWLLDNVPKVVEAVNDGRCLFGNVDSWLVWNLTGGVNGGCHVTDVTNASRTMLMDLHTLQWDKTLCRFFDVPEHILPEIRSSSEVYGHLSETSIKGTPISGILGDQQAALVGQACLKSGYGKNTYGTGCFLLYNTGGVPVISEHGLLTTVAYQLGKNKPVHYALEGSIAIAGAAVQWLRDNIGIISTSADIETLAKTVDTSHGCYFVPAFSGLFCPYWHTDARGLICGLTQFTTKAHVARATLEAVCFQTREILEAMKQDSNIEMQSLQVDGGMTANELLMQLQADLIGIPVVRPSMPETTALGAAIAAGQAEGIDVWNQDNLTAITTDTFLPTVTEEERDKRFSHWKEAVKRCMHWKASGVVSNADTTVDAKWTTFPGCMFLLLSAATWIGAELLANAKE